MSATTQPSSAEQEEFVARLRRMNVETEKFVAEARKLSAEHDKLAAEALKLQRDRLFAPVLAVAALAAAIGAIVSKLL